MRHTLALFALAAPLTGLAAELSTRTATAPRAREIAIYPGFAKHELINSVEDTLLAAQACITAGSAEDRPRSMASQAPYFSVTAVDGKPAELWERSIEVSCRAQPVTRCNFNFVWDDAGSNLAYATIDCIGSHTSPRDRYSVTAVVDLPKAQRTGKELRGYRATTLSFFTDAFPGTTVWAHTRTSRASGEVIEAPTVTQFDDWQSTEEELQVVLSTPMVLEAADRVIETACRAVGAPGCAITAE
jgi:hypothetical protein